MTVTKTRKLHEVIAIEKGVASRCKSAVDELQKVLAKPVLFNGETRKYTPVEEGGESYDDQYTRVQFQAHEVIQQIAQYRQEAVDVEATKDLTNTFAKADLIVGDNVIACGVPVSALLYLEKELVDFRTIVQLIPTLDPSFEWSHDPNGNLYRSHETKTYKTKKVEQPIVLYQATDKHPAQTQLITKDVNAGIWTTIKQSGAMPTLRKVELLARVNALLDAVKAARERANSVDVVEFKLGKEIFSYLLR